MRPTQCVGGLYLTVADSLALQHINYINNKIFQVNSNCGKQKKVFANFLQAFWRFSTRFQRYKKKQCCPRAEDTAIFEDLRLRGQGQGLDLRGLGQGQGLQNVSSRTSSMPRTSSRTPPLIFSCISLFSTLP